MQSPEPSGWAGDPAVIEADVASGLIPPYYVAVQGGGYAFVLQTTTGATLATIRAPGAGTDVAKAAGAPDDRTFVLETQPQAGSDQPYAFYLLRLSSSGQPEPLRRLPVSIPAGQWPNGLALSPDADRLAVATVSEGTAQGREFGIEEYSLATGAVRTWTANSPTPVENGSVLAWTQDEQTLSFPWGPSTGVRLLSLDAAGGDLLTASRPVVLGTDQGWVCGETPEITPDGKTLACGARPSTTDGTGDDAAAIAEYDAADGAPERVLGPHLGTTNGATLLWQNTSGSVEIGTLQGPFQSCPTALPPTVGVFRGGRFVALPGMPVWFAGTFTW